MLVVTTNDLPGYRVVKNFGVVRGYLNDAEATRARRAGGVTTSELRTAAAAPGGDQMDLF